MSLPPPFTTAFYRLLATGAKKLNVARAKLAMDALRHYLKETQKKNAPTAKLLGSEELSERFRDVRSKLAKKWWSTVSEKERTERGRKAVQGRWGKGKKKPDRKEPDL